jgi:hypothetical protein
VRWWCWSFESSDVEAGTLQPRLDDDITLATIIPLYRVYAHYSIKISDNISFQDDNGNNCSILVELVVPSQRHDEYLSPGSKAVVRLGQSQKGKRGTKREKRIKTRTKYSLIYVL